jgi:hypothetical protein
MRKLFFGLTRPKRTRAKTFGVFAHTAFGLITTL